MPPQKLKVYFWSCISSKYWATLPTGSVELPPYLVSRATGSVKYGSVRGVDEALITGAVRPIGILMTDGFANLLSLLVSDMY